MGIKEYLQSRDVSPSDVGPFLLIHTVLSGKGSYFRHMIRLSMIDLLIRSSWCLTNIFNCSVYLAFDFFKCPAWRWCSIPIHNSQINFSCSCRFDMVLVLQRFSISMQSTNATIQKWANASINVAKYACIYADDIRWDQTEGFSSIGEFFGYLSAIIVHLELCWYWCITWIFIYTHLLFIYIQLSLEKASRSSKPVKYLERKVPSLDATRVCVSYAEAKFGRLFFKPITVPGRVWLSFNGTKVWKQIGSNATARSDVSNTKEKTAFIDRSLLRRSKHIRSNMIHHKSNAIFIRECRDFTNKPCSR